MKIFIHKTGERGAGLFETIVREAGGRRQANHIKGGGRLDLCDIPLLTICKLYKHVMCEINNECGIDEWAWLTELRLSVTHAHFRLPRPKMVKMDSFPKTIA